MFLLLIFIVGCISIYWFFRVPSFLQHIPSLSVFHVAIPTFNKGEQQSYLRPNKILNNGLATYWFGGVWTVRIGVAQVGKEILQKPSVHPKFLLTDILPTSLLTQFLGVNIIFSAGEIWKRHRKIVRSCFQSQLECSIVVDFAQKFLNQIDKSCHSVDVHYYMQRLTLDVLCEAVFGLKLNCIEKQNVDFVDKYNAMMADVMNPIYIIFNFLESRSNPFRKQTYENMKWLEDFISNLIEQKRSILINSKRSETLSKRRDLLTEMILANEENEIKLTSQELRNNVLILFLAGHDTTAWSLSAILYNLAKYPDVQELARQEVKHISAKSIDTFNLTHSQLKDMNFLEAVIKETMRLYPSVPVLPMRKCGQSFQVNGYTVPEGSILSLDITCMQRDPQVWSQPDEFIPDRFLNNKVADSNLFSFGGGSRICLGQSFAMIQMKTVLAIILQKYEVRFDNSSPESCKLNIQPNHVLEPINLRLTFNAL